MRDTIDPQPSITVFYLTYQLSVVELNLPLFINTGGLDEETLFILVGLIIHAPSYSCREAETQAQMWRGPGGQ